MEETRPVPATRGTSNRHDSVAIATISCRSKALWHRIDDSSRRRAPMKGNGWKNIGGHLKKERDTAAKEMARVGRYPSQWRSRWHESDGVINVFQPNYGNSGYGQSAPFTHRVPWLSYRCEDRSSSAILFTVGGGDVSGGGDRVSGNERNLSSMALQMICLVY